MSLNAPLTTVYKEKNGSIITTDIYLPECNSASPKKYPVVIDIHGGAFMLGNSRMVSLPQVSDCLSRGWIVVVPNHRLCPSVSLLRGPIEDIRDLTWWIQCGNFNTFLEQYGPHRADVENIAAFGTSSGGTLALALAFDARKPIKAILSLYGPVNFKHPFWNTPLPQIAAKLPKIEDPSFLEQVYKELPAPTDSSISLEGQSETGVSQGPDFSRPRDLFAFTQIANGSVLDAIYPEHKWEHGDYWFAEVDAYKRVDKDFPPVYIVHGVEDEMVPIELSRMFYEELKKEGVECGMTEVPGEGHTFAAKMEVGSRTWELQREGFDFLERFIGRG